jgi:hypothetical protein
MLSSGARRAQQFLQQTSTCGQHCFAQHMLPSLQIGGGRRSDAIHPLADFLVFFDLVCGVFFTAAVRAAASLSCSPTFSNSLTTC